MDDMLAKLAEAVRVNRESGIAVREYTDAVRALAQVCEDEDIKNEYLTRLEEVNGKKGFVDAIRAVMLPGAAMTPIHIKSLIVLLRKMDLSGYSNAMASIHTTLRRMREAGEIEDAQTPDGAKAYRLPLGSKGPSKAELEEQARTEATMSAADRFKLVSIRREASGHKTPPKYVADYLERNKPK
jgi:hypothetical protein